jgi:hypothetical protein
VIYLTPDQQDTLACLVMLRKSARSLIKAQKIVRQTIDILKQNHDAAIQAGDRKAEALAKIDIDAGQEQLLELRFSIIEVGNFFNRASSQFDQLPREVWLRALSVNESEWHTPDMLKYGDTIRHVVGVLDLENSATKDDAIEFKPLKWCVTMAIMNATATNPKLGEFMHDACNEMFGGAFGEYQPPTMFEQLGVPS